MLVLKKVIRDGLPFFVFGDRKQRKPFCLTSVFQKKKMPTKLSSIHNTHFLLMLKWKLLF